MLLVVFVTIFSFLDFPNSLNRGNHYNEIVYLTLKRKIMFKVIYFFLYEAPSKSNSFPMNSMNNFYKLDLLVL